MNAEARMQSTGVDAEPEFTIRDAYDAGYQSALESLSGAPSSDAFTADAAQRAMDVRLAREAADARLRRLDEAERQGRAAYQAERKRQGLIP
ncbi:hypothetical protein [Microbacterium sp. NPDC058389]|uniref:hypothetical protein n=1 Tax=Microbacterium sp. NPDC058389 TaxID=3346475 RepID=UPI003648C0C6